MRIPFDLNSNLPDLHVPSYKVILSSPLLLDFCVLRRSHDTNARPSSTESIAPQHTVAQDRHGSESEKARQIDLWH
jgi:hypothetical protein